MKKLIRMTLIAFILTGCQSDPEWGEKPFNKSTQVHSSGINRIEDREAGVVCWTYGVRDGGGISCLPISDTKLIRSEE